MKIFIILIIILLTLLLIPKKCFLHILYFITFLLLISIDFVLNTARYMARWRNW